MAAIHRATALQQHGPFHADLPPHITPPHVQHPRFLPESERGAHVASDFHPSLGPSGHATSTYVPFSPPHLYQREVAGKGSKVQDKFAPGNESESVLKLTKRPKLRPKDLSHRRSLGQGEPLRVDEGNAAQFLSPGYSLRYAPLPSSGHLTVTLFFGQRQVVLTGSASMTVDDLQQTAGSIAELAPSSIRLMHGETLLRLGTTLEDYPAFISVHVIHLSVTTTTSVASGAGIQTVFSLSERDQTLPQHNETFQASPGAGLPRANSASPTFGEWGVNGVTGVADRDCTPALSSMRSRVGEGVQSARAERAPFEAGETSYLILLTFEDGHSTTQVVWSSMKIWRLCAQVGELAHVSPDTVFCYFAGSVLDTERLISDPPAIGSRARVFVFFFIARALKFVVHTLQGGSPPPTTPPPALPVPQPFGPPVPPGFVRYPPTTTPAPASTPSVPPPRDHLPASDRLRSTFKCPKFLGEVRH
jgi:hypothetical protein